MTVGQIVSELYKYSRPIPKVGQGDLLFGRNPSNMQDPSTDKV